MLTGAASTMWRSFFTAQMIQEDSSSRPKPPISTILRITARARARERERERAASLSADFDHYGNIRTTRVPIGPTVIIAFHGGYWFLILKSNYAHLGQYWQSTGWRFSARMERNRRTERDEDSTISLQAT